LAKLAKVSLYLEVNHKRYFSPIGFNDTLEGNTFSGGLQAPFPGN